MKMQFLLDEHLSLRLAAAIQHRNPCYPLISIIPYNSHNDAKGGRSEV
jgi:hypothetical protein